MPVYQYDVVNLKAEFDAHDRRKFRWKSKRGGCQDVDQDGLENLLNDRGQDGWSVVAFDTDARFGSNLVLQKALPDNDQQPKRTPKTINAEPLIPPAPIVVSAPPVDLAPLLAELQALRQEVAAQRDQDFWHQPMDAAKRLQEEQQERWAEESSRYLHSEEFKEALAPILEELKAQREPKSIEIGPVTATLSPEAAEQIGARLERALVQAVEIATAPRFIPAEIPGYPIKTEPKFDRKPWFSWSWVTGIGR